MVGEGKILNLEAWRNVSGGRDTVPREVGTWWRRKRFGISEDEETVAEDGIR